MSGYGYSSLQDHAWIPARASFTLEPYCTATILQHLMYNGQYLVLVGPALGPLTDRVFFINGPTQIPANQFGRVTMAADRPVLARCELNGPTPSYGRNCPFGPIPDLGPSLSSGKLYPGIPGFRLLDAFAATNTHPDGLCLVVRDSCAGTWWCKATTNWWGPTGSYRFDDPAVVTANPCVDRHGSDVYDGSSPYRPQLNWAISLPRNHFNQGTAVAPLIPRDPNIRTGNVFQYTLNNDSIGSSGASLGLTGVNYLDAKVGTVCLWTYTIAGNIVLPQGWALMDGTSNSSALGGSAVDMRSYFVVGFDPRTGGAVPVYGDATGKYQFIGTAGNNAGITHDHFASTTVNGFARINPADPQYLQPADHRPPFKTLAYVERVW